MAQPYPGNGPGFQPNAAVVPASKLELSISCRNLRDRDTFSKSDPMCVVFMKTLAQESYREIGRTEMVKDCLNPDFVHKFIVDFYFEESQKMRFEIYDVDSPTGRLDKQDFLGRIECTLGEIVGSPGSVLDRPLIDGGRNSGRIIVRSEEVNGCNDTVTFEFCATKLDKKDFFGKSDPFLVFSRSNEDNSFTVVHKTEVVKSNLNPRWKPFTLKVRVLCNGDYDRPIRVECFDWNDGGNNDFIGSCLTTMKEMSSQVNLTHELINAKKKASKKGYKNSGQLVIAQCKVLQCFTFLDYIKGGLQLNFTVAIDFTASNGDPRQPSSLHYFDPYQPNMYSRALQAVGEIIQDYDSDKMFPALGFGAMLPTGAVSHEFYLNGNPQNPYCSGIAGVMDSYRRTLAAVKLHGPTNFSPVINHVARFANSYQDGSHYFVLLILTDGVITDMANTKQAIIEASRLPMSIIIVGIGNAEFDAMEELDADNQRLSYQGRFAERDIVQFVPFRDFIGGRYGGNLAMSQAYLAKEVLAEIPDQITEYMQKRGVKPQPPPTLQQAPPTSNSSAPMW